MTSKQWKEENGWGPDGYKTKAVERQHQRAKAEANRAAKQACWILGITLVVILRAIILSVLTQKPIR